MANEQIKIQKVVNVKNAETPKRLNGKWQKAVGKKAIGFSHKEAKRQRS